MMGKTVTEHSALDMALFIAHNVTTLYQIVMADVMRSYMLSAMTIGGRRSMAIGFKLWLQNLAPEKIQRDEQRM